MSTARSTVCLLLVLLSAGCGSSSATIIEPTTPQGFAALHFDSLLGSACNSQGADRGPDPDRCQFLASFAVPLAFGASAGPITIDSGTGPFVWQGFVLDVVDTSASTGTEVDSLTFMVFSDTNVSAGVVFRDYNSSSARLTDGTNADGVNAVSWGLTVGAVVGPCATPPTLRYTSMPSVKGAACTVQTFGIVQTLTFQSGAIYNLPQQNLNGIRIVRVVP